MEQIMNAYYANNAKRLHKAVDKILARFEGISDKDKDDFYSLANEVFVDVMRRYEDSQPFDAFLHSCLQNRIKTEMTRRNREKRKADRLAISLDAPVGEGETLTVGEMLADPFDIEMQVLGREDSQSLKVLSYLANLSRRQRRVAELLADSYGAGEIRDILHLTKKEYADAVSGICAYENISLLF